MSDILMLKEEASDFEVLYAEDNDALREKAGKLLAKVFKKVYKAKDGEEALLLFKQHTPPIIITDINMPKTDGLELAIHIHSTHSETKIIIMSAYDSGENLLKSIKSGIFDFLKKPVNIQDLSDVLLRAIKEIKDEEEKKIFYAQLSDIFNYQSAIAIMLKGREIQLVSQQFLDFFQVESAKDFNDKFHDLGSKFLKHEGFLYNTSKKDWFEEASKNPDRLYHVKIADLEHHMHHFIFKLHFIPNKEGYSIISLDDITELNLLGLFDKKQEESDSYEQEQKAIFDLLGVILNNNAKIKLHNYYKGLSIVNDAIISNITNGKITIKTTFIQQKAILREKQAIISSDALPKVILCKNVVKNDLDNQQIVFSNLRFLAHSALERKSIRVEPDSEHKISLFFNGHKSLATMKILDISVNGIKIESSAIPIGLEENDKVRLDMVFTLEKRHIIINTDATVYKIVKKDKIFYIVCLLEPTKSVGQTLTEYISKQQIKLIREFKGLR